MLPSQGLVEDPATESYFHRAALGGLTIWYTGAANQTAHSAAGAGLNNIFAYAVPLQGGVIDTVAFEVTAGVATAVGRCGLYKNTSDLILYPSSLVVDGGEFDCSTNSVKSTSGLSINITTGLYWFVFSCGVATITGVRAIVVGAQSHITGIASTMGANLNTVITGGNAYSALPASFPAAIPLNGAGTTARMVAIHYAS